MSFSLLQQARLSYVPLVPPAFSASKSLPSLEVAAEVKVSEDIRRLFPLTSNQPAVRLEADFGSTSNQGVALRVGVVLSGGPAPGGHNVIAGLFDYLKARNSYSQLYGFLGGPKGIITGKYVKITDSLIPHYRNQGGFDIIGTGRDKIEKPVDFESSKQTVEKLDLDGLVVIGGDDSNTNAAVLAEYFLQNKLKTKVIGVPKTIDGDLKNEFVEISFGFDTATKLYASLIANLATDANSSLKYYHFIRLMGRSASHITLECALQTHANIAFIGEEVAAKQETLENIVKDIGAVIIERSLRGVNHGIILIPEGLIEFIPEIGLLIREINDLLAKKINHDAISDKLSPKSKKVFDLLPETIREELLLDRDPHGNVQVSRIETEKLLLTLVSSYLAHAKTKGKFTGNFNALSHFFGYEGRCVLPSNFDANYCASLGKTAGALIEHGKTGLMAVVQNLTAPVDKWHPGGYPLTAMMDIEHRKGKEKAVIKKALVDLSGKPFQTLCAHRKLWSLSTNYRNPGSIQYYGPVAEILNLTLQLEHQKPLYSSLTVSAKL